MRSARSYRLANLRSGNEVSDGPLVIVEKNFTTLPISPSLAPIENFFRVSTLLSMLSRVFRWLTGFRATKMPWHLKPLTRADAVFAAEGGPQLGHAWNCLCAESATEDSRENSRLMALLHRSGGAAIVEPINTPSFLSNRSTIYANGRSPMVGP